MTGKGNLKIALLISFFSLIACFLGIIAIFHYLFPFIFLLPFIKVIFFFEPSIVYFFFFIVIPFCGAYAAFCLCYSGKLYVGSGVSALKVPAFFSIIPFICYIISPIPLILYTSVYNLGADNPPRPFNPIIARQELNEMENIRWAQLKIGYMEFQTDDEIDKEIVYGKTGYGWNVDISDSKFGGQNCGWMEGSPTPEGGEIICKFDSFKLIRKKATLDSPATWSVY